MKPLFSFLCRTLIAGITVVSALAQAQSTVNQADSRVRVVGWIPAYGVEKSREALNADPAIVHGLTRIGLQFWNPSADGKSLVFAPVDESGKLVT